MPICTICKIFAIEMIRSHFYFGKKLSDPHHHPYKVHNDVMERVHPPQGLPLIRGAVFIEDPALPPPKLTTPPPQPGGYPLILPRPLLIPCPIPEPGPLAVCSPQLQPRPRLNSTEVLTILTHYRLFLFRFVHTLDPALTFF